jgi:hypothetical protein
MSGGDWVVMVVITGRGESPCPGRVFYRVGRKRWLLGMWDMHVRWGVGGVWDGYWTCGKCTSGVRDLLSVRVFG